MGYLDGSRHLFLAQFQCLPVAAGVHHSTGSHEFNPVGAVLDVVAHRRADLVHGISQVGTTLQSVIRSKRVAVAMAAGYRNAVTRRYHAWSTDQSQPYAVAQSKL